MITLQGTIACDHQGGCDETTTAPLEIYETEEITSGGEYVKVLKFDLGSPTDNGWSFPTKIGSKHICPKHKGY